MKNNIRIAFDGAHADVDLLLVGEQERKEITAYVESLIDSNVQYGTLDGDTTLIIPNREASSDEIALLSPYYVDETDPRQIDVSNVDELVCIVDGKKFTFLTDLFPNCERSWYCDVYCGFVASDATVIDDILAYVGDTLTLYVGDTCYLIHNGMITLAN